MNQIKWNIPIFTECETMDQMILIASKFNRSTMQMKTLRMLFQWLHHPSQNRKLIFPLHHDIITFELTVQICENHYKTLQLSHLSLSFQSKRPSLVQMDLVARSCPNLSIKRLNRIIEWQKSVGTENPIMNGTLPNWK